MLVSLIIRYTHVLSNTCIIILFGTDVKVYIINQNYAFIRGLHAKKADKLKRPFILETSVDLLNTIHKKGGS